MPFLPFSAEFSKLCEMCEQMASSSLGLPDSDNLSAVIVKVAALGGKRARQKTILKNVRSLSGLDLSKMPAMYSKQGETLFDTEDICFLLCSLLCSLTLPSFLPHIKFGIRFFLRVEEEEDKLNF
jgi:hypothetical protein